MIIFFSNPIMNPLAMVRKKSQRHTPAHIPTPHTLMIYGIEKKSNNFALRHPLL